jgi:hypothetical protein
MSQKRREAGRVNDQPLITAMSVEDDSAWELDQAGRRVIQMTVRRINRCQTLRV